MPPIKLNPKFLKHKEIASQRGISEANKVLMSDFRVESIAEMEGFKNWLMGPLTFIKNTYNFVIVGGLIYIYMRNTKGSKNNMLY